MPISTVESAAYELRQMELYLDFLRLAVQNVEEKLEIKYSPEDLDKVINSDEFSTEMEEYNKYLDLFGSLYGDFPRRLYSSFIVSWYSFIEDTLGKVCDELSSNQRKLAEFKNRGLLLVQEIFNNSDIEFIPNHLKELKMINIIRNRIVHNGGTYPIFHEKPVGKRLLGPFRYIDEYVIERDYYLDMDKNFHKYLQENKVLRIYKSAIILPEIDYCYHLVSLGRELLNDIFTKVHWIDNE